MSKRQIQLGDTVKLPKYLAIAKAFPKELRGLVVYTDGYNHEVQPVGCWWVARLYDNELKFEASWGGTEKELRQYCKKFHKFYEWIIKSKGNV